ncbi:unnamed protein product [Diamesa serratosioi]
MTCGVEPKVLTDAEITDLMTSRRRCGDILNKSIDNVCLATVGQIKSIRSKMHRRSTRSTTEYDFEGVNENENKIFPAEMFERKRRNIIRECCRNPCTVETLIHFCPTQY